MLHEPRDPAAGMCVHGAGCRRLAAVIKLREASAWLACEEWPNQAAPGTATAMVLKHAAYATQQLQSLLSRCSHGHDGTWHRRDASRPP